MFFPTSTSSVELGWPFLNLLCVAHFDSSRRSILSNILGSPILDSDIALLVLVSVSLELLWVYPNMFLWCRLVEPLLPEGNLHLHLHLRRLSCLWCFLPPLTTIPPCCHHDWHWCDQVYLTNRHDEHPNAALSKCHQGCSDGGRVYPFPPIQSSPWHKRYTLILPWWWWRQREWIFFWKEISKWSLKSSFKMKILSTVRYHVEFNG